MQDSYSRKAMMGRGLMAPRTDRATRILSGAHIIRRSHGITLEEVLVFDLFNK